MCCGDFCIFMRSKLRNVLGYLLVLEMSGFELNVFKIKVFRELIIFYRFSSYYLNLRGNINVKISIIC